jgi:hypothetical protein
MQKTGQDLTKMGQDLQLLDNKQASTNFQIAYFGQMTSLGQLT